MPVRLTERADADIADLYRQGILSFGSVQADRYLTSLFDTFDLIARFPRIGRDFRSPYRMYVDPPHVVVYLIDPDGRVEVDRVVHGHSNWRDHLG